MNVHENAEEDDDLPVLTDVLRVRAPAPREALDPRRSPADQAPSDEAVQEAGAGSERARGEQLVIGTTIDTSSARPPAATEQIAAVAPVEATTQTNLDPEGIAAAPHVEPFDDEDEVFLEGFDGVATPEDLNAIEHLSEGDALLAAPAAAPPFDSDAMAARIRDAVLGELAQRIDTELDARLAQSVAAQLESALAGLQSGLRASLSDALRDVVRRAVDDELARDRLSRDP